MSARIDKIIKLSSKLMRCDEDGNATIDLHNVDDETQAKMVALGKQAFVELERMKHEDTDRV